jgi:hypothetical protein
MKIQPLAEDKATESVATSYSALKHALKTQSLPVFFTYLGPFPEYLSYLTEQLVKNLEDNRFEMLVEEAAKQFIDLIQEDLPDSEEKTEWLQKYHNSPSFFYFKKDTESIFRTNVKLCFVFIALREAVKGWAVAAKHLSSSTTPASAVDEEETEKDFIFEDILLANNFQSLTFTAASDAQISRKNTELVPASQSAIEKNLLPEYLEICRNDVRILMKKQEFLFLRVTFEKTLLAYIGLFPHLIFSPINVFYNFNAKYQHFPDLLYLLSEHFPTYAVQRMMFSGYMLK